MKIKDVVFSIFSLLITVGICLLAFVYKDNLYIFYRDYIIHERDNINITNNDYFKDYNFLYVQNTNNFIAKNKQDVNNIIYTILNSGENNFTFYCDDNYDECLSYVGSIANDNNILSSLNNFVDPFNSFKTIDISYTSKGKISLNINKNYTDKDITEINNKIDEIIKYLNLDNTTEEEKITKIHNYIIDNAKYKIDDETKNLDKANGVLILGFGSCNSYTDAMALFLDRLNIENYKIASENHIWNLVNIDNNFYHIDVTWDDPVLSDGSDRLETIFLLITDERLKELDTKEHNYDSNIYLELK